MGNLDRLLKFDGLDTAECVTGKSYKTDEATQALGFALMAENAAHKREALTAAGDTTGSDTLERYQAIIAGAGYELAYEEGFASDHNGEPERLFVYAHRDGLLLHFDTYCGVRVNGGKVHYNWKPANPDTRWALTSSGGYSNYDDPENRVWVGDHDCREALLHNMQKLRDNGALLSPWVKRPTSLWVAHYMDWRTAPEGHHERVGIINERTTERLRQCPEWVREMVLFSDSGSDAERGDAVAAPSEGSQSGTRDSAGIAQPGPVL